MSFITGFVFGALIGMGLAMIFNIKSYEKGLEDGKKENNG